METPGCVFTVIGYCSNPKVLEQAQKRSKNPIQIFGSVSHEEALEVLDQADIFINIGNNTPHMIPSKIFEYMSYGKPIISTCPIENEPCVPYLRQYSLALLLSEDLSRAERDARTVDRFISDCAGKKVGFDATEAMLYRNTPRAFAETIDGLFGQGKEENQNDKKTD